MFTSRFQQHFLYKAFTWKRFALRDSNKPSIHPRNPGNGVITQIEAVAFLQRNVVLQHDVTD